jgi:hypothetical protein
MILLIIFGLLWIISLIFIVKSNGFDGVSVLMSLASLTILTFFLLLFNLSISAIWLNKKNVSFTKNIEPIASLKYNNSGLHGSFFLGSGTIENRRYYYFMKKNNDGSFSESRMLAPDTKIFEDSDSINQPYIVRTYNYTITSPTLKLFLLKPKGKINVEDSGNSCGCKSNNKAEIHIPKGTIIQEYQISL